MSDPTDPLVEAVAKAMKDFVVKREARSAARSMMLNPASEYVDHSPPPTFEEMARATLEAVQAHQWRTIDSAPRDGTCVLLSCGTEDPFLSCGLWFSYERDAPRSDGYQWEGWVEPYDHTDLTDPTHWMPLPPPPGER